MHVCYFEYICSLFNCSLLNWQSAVLLTYVFLSHTDRLVSKWNHLDFIPPPSKVMHQTQPVVHNDRRRIIYKSAHLSHLVIGSVENMVGIKDIGASVIICFLAMG